MRKLKRSVAHAKMRKEGFKKSINLDMIFKGEGRQVILRKIGENIFEEQT